MLSKGDVKSQKLRVEFSLEDMDTDGFKKGATYNDIRDWIKEKYGYRVTNLNIAQVKQKYGIIERENYNKPKLPDSKQPGCPEEKVKAIEDAMMILKIALLQLLSEGGLVGQLNKGKAACKTGSFPKVQGF